MRTAMIANRPKPNRIASMKAATVLGLCLLAFAIPARPVLADLSIVKNTNLEFGSMVPASGGTAVVSASGTRTVTGGVIGLRTPSRAPAAASFTVTGDAGQIYAIVLPATPAVLTSGVNALNVDTFTKVAVSGILGKLSSTTPGTQTFKVGAKLHVGANQAPGRYLGSFTVEIAYN